MTDRVLSQFRNIHEIYERTAAETATQLGPAGACVLVEFANDAIDISGALTDSYGHEDLVQSLAYFDFHALHARLTGMHYDFLAGRYESVRRDLRFTWESIFRSCLADRFRELRPDDPNPPGPTADAKANWLAELERRLNWNTAILPVFRYIFPLWTEDQVKGEFKPVWDRLNTAAHPSGEWRANGIGDSMRHVWHHFDETQALELIADARVVFAVAFAAVLVQFQEAAAILARKSLVFKECPAVRLLLPPGTLKGGTPDDA